ncbi:MAG: hypothetical protein ACK2U9_14220 [Anaerolineae bacterium]
MTRELVLVPTAELFTAFNGGQPSWVWRPKDIPVGQSIRAYMCSEPDSGWRYYKENKDVVLSKEYPENWEDDIGYAFGHGPGKTDDHGNPKEDRDYPRKILLLRLWIVENGQMVAGIIDGTTLQKRLSEATGAPDYGLLRDRNSGAMVSNFYLQVRHPKAKGQDAYSLDAYLRPTDNEKIWLEAAKPWHPENYWLGLNPFDPPAQPPANAGRPMATLPASTVDEHGADVDQTVGPADDNW